MSSQPIEVPGTEHPEHGFFPPPGLYPGPGWKIMHVTKKGKNREGYFIEIRRNGGKLVVHPGWPQDATDEYFFRRFYAITNFCKYHRTADSVRMKHLLMDHPNAELHPMGQAQAQWASARRGEVLLRSSAYSAVTLVGQAENVLGSLNNNQQIPLHERIVAALTGAVWSMFTALFQSVYARQVNAIMNPEGTYDEVIETVGATMLSTVGGFDFGFFNIEEPDDYTAGDCILYVGTAVTRHHNSPRQMTSHSSVKSLAVHTLFCNLKRDGITLGGDNKGMVVNIIKDILGGQDYSWVLKHDDEASVWTMNKLTTNNFHTEMKRGGVICSIYDGL